LVEGEPVNKFLLDFLWRLLASNPCLARRQPWMPATGPSPTAVCCKVAEPALHGMRPFLQEATTGIHINNRERLINPISAKAFVSASRVCYI